MALGDRKLSIMDLHITRGNPVFCTGTWQLKIEGKGGDVPVSGGQATFSLGAPAAARAMTLQQIETAAIAAVEADPATPAHEATA